MKQVLLFLSLVMAVGATAQTSPLTINPTTAKKDFSVNLSDPFLDLEATATVTNTSKDTLRLKWKRVELSRPSAWATQVCDGVECFDEIVSSNIDPKLGLNAPFVLAPGKKVEFIFHLLPNKTAGVGKFAIDFSRTSKPDSILGRMNFDVTVTSRTTSTKEVAAEGLALFPNPTVDFFQLKNGNGVERVVVYNVLGTVVRQFEANQERYRIDQLPDGLYLVGLVDRSNRTIKTLRLLKRSIRP